MPAHHLNIDDGNDSQAADCILKEIILVPQNHT
jgi:hypothetical protein